LPRRRPQEAQAGGGEEQEVVDALVEERVQTGPTDAERLVAGLGRQQRDQHGGDQRAPPAPPDAKRCSFAGGSHSVRRVYVPRSGYRMWSRSWAAGGPVRRADLPTKPRRSIPVKISRDRYARCS